MTSSLWKRHQLTWVGVVFVGLALAGYGPTLGDFFLSDDFGALEMVVRAEGWRDSLAVGGGFRQSWLRPLPNLLWWWNYRLFDLEPLGYRLTNALLHAFNGFLLALLAGRLTASRRAALLAGALFVLFPIHPEAVTWVCARYDLLCTTGVLAALVAWHAFLGPGGRAFHGAASIFAAAIALASKEMAFALVPLLLLMTWSRPRSRRTWVGLGAMGLVFAAYGLLRLDFLGGLGGMPGEGGRLTSQLRPGRPSFAFHALTYSFAPTLRLPLGGPWLPLQALPVVALLLGALTVVRGGLGTVAARALGWALAAFALSLLPLASWATFWGGHGTRYLYLPAAFSCIGMGIALVELVRFGRTLRAAAVAATMLAFLGGLALLNGQWHAAAQQARTMVERLPPVPPDSTLSLTGLPTHHGDAHLFLNGFREAARLYGGAEGRVRLLDRATWTAERERPRRPAQRFLAWDEQAQDWR